MNNKQSLAGFTGKKSVLGVLGIIILLAGIAIGALLVQQNQDLREKAAPATTAFISPSSSEVGQGKNFSFWVKMDTGVNALTGVDIRLNFNKDAFEITSIEKGVSVQNLENTISSTFDNGTGTLKYIVFTLDKTKAVSGSQVEVLRVNAKTKANSALGNYSISFDSLTAASGTTETLNIITSTTPGNLTIVSGNGANDIYIEGEPNSCGGTCGSNQNCKANFFCYEGFCRNPDCPNDKTCGCASPAITSTIKPKASSTPEVVYYNNMSTIKPTVTISPIKSATPLPDDGDLTPGGLSTEKTKKAALWIGLILGAVAIIIGISSFFKKKDGDQVPPITPPEIPKSDSPVENPPQTW